jgi:ferrochelatase
MTGVILLQLGTPDEPTPEALRRYLREFLSDRRVIDLNRAIWLPILYGVVLRSRPKMSAALYRKVWTPAGSPLLVTTKAQASALEERLTAAAGQRLHVVVGMRYGRPSIAEAVEQLAAAGVDRVLAFPMYPQYAGATTGSSLERLFEVIATRRVVPAVRVVPPYYDDAGYINALAAVARDALASRETLPARLLLSFHGLPKRYADEGDPYPEQCDVTAHLVTRALNLASEQTQVVYQSRFGREVWLQPYTDKTLEELGRAGVSVAVMSPGFTADCLETLEEIRLRGAEQFHEAGGKDFVAIPCLNEHPVWLDAMATLALRELRGWIDKS